MTNLQRRAGIQDGVLPGLRDALLVLLLTVTGFAVMGYHPGVEDDGVYLSAVKAGVNPALYPHDADFFRLQLQASIFDRWMAGFVRVTGIPIPWAELLWQLLSLYTILWAARRIARRLFPDPHAHWAGVALLAAMLTLPVAGAAINLADQHLHPRNMATALILLAVDRTLARKTRYAVLLLLLALLVHPIMAAFGISLCFFLVLALTGPVYGWFHGRPAAARPQSSLAAAFPLHWMFEPPSPSWRRALNTRTYYFLYQWTWYEWLGAIGPLVLFWALSRHARSRGRELLDRFALGLLLYGVLQQAIAMVILAPPALVRLTPLQPMRYLHLVYLFLVLVGGCLAGQYLLKRSVWRWAIFLLVCNASMFMSQRFLFPASAHLELPGRTPGNPWLQAFAWVRDHTPRDAYFALDPQYLAAPGEDYHSFRALAERSQLADAIKDAAVVTQVPELGPHWAEQVDAQAGWDHFQLADFERLRDRFGVGWVLVSYPPPARLTCIWHNRLLAVCRIPARGSP